MRAKYFYPVTRHRGVIAEFQKNGTRVYYLKENLGQMLKRPVQEGHFIVHGGGWRASITGVNEESRRDTQRNP